MIKQEVIYTMTRKCSHPVQPMPMPSMIVVDNLMQIKGIGPNTAARLREAGVQTFLQLSMLNPEGIAAHVPGISKKRIIRENWVKQARKLSKMAKPSQTEGMVADSEIQQHYATFTVELLLGRDNRVRRTHITNVQTKTEETWAGWKETKLEDFISRYAYLSVPIRETSVSTRFTPQSDTSPPNPDTAVSVQDQKHELEQNTTPHTEVSLTGILRVYELTTTFLQSNTPQNIAYVGDPFNVRIFLDLTDVKIAPSMQLAYTAIVWAKKFGTVTRQIVAEESGILMPVERFPCSVKTVIQSPGTYRLEVVISLMPEGITPSPRSTLRAWKESALLQVC